MRLFVTGATGFVGFHVVKELLSAGHQVLGLARSGVGAELLSAIGAEVQRGTMEDLDGLRRVASASDGVLHLAFNHDFSKFQENCEVDQRAIEALGAGLAGSERPLIVTSGLAGLVGPGQVANEDTNIPSTYLLPRVSEQTALTFKEVNASVVRLSQIHDQTKAGVITYLVALAREKGMSAYVEEGRNRWAAAHVLDTARLYRLALEKPVAGARYHAVDEEGIPLREIAEAIGQRWQLPVTSLSADEAATHFGWLAAFTGADIMASSDQTRQRLGWQPTGPKLLGDLQRWIDVSPVA